MGSPNKMAGDQTDTITVDDAAALLDFEFRFKGNDSYPLKRALDDVDKLNRVTGRDCRNVLISRSLVEAVMKPECSFDTYNQFDAHLTEATRQMAA
jgi:hypothetical protein